MEPHSASVYLKLDSEDVIRAKDEGTWKPSHSELNQDGLPAKTPETKADINSGMADRSSKVPNHPERGRQALNLSTQRPVEHSSRLGNIAPQTSVIQSRHTTTEHAISGTHQHVSTLFDSVSTRKQHVVQYKTRKSELTMDVKSQKTKNAHGNGGTTHPKKTHNTPEKESLDAKSNNKGRDLKNPKTSRQKQRPSVSSRPKRNLRTPRTLQLQTEVDWDEDLRPTPNDESLKADSDAQGTSVSTPSPGSTSMLNKHSKQKRKRPRSRPSPEKRKKPGKEAATGTNEKDQESPQLLLTADPGILPTYQLASCLEPDLAPFDGLSETPDINSGKARVGSSKEPGVIVEILSSRASPNTGSYTSDDNLDNPKSYVQQQTGASHDGRGKAVGQKLCDALRAIELHSQLMPAFETKTHPRKAGAATDRESPSIKPCHARVQSAQAQSSSREFSASKTESKKKQNNLPRDQKPVVPDLLQPGSSVRKPTPEIAMLNQREQRENKLRKSYAEPQMAPRSRQATGSDTHQALEELTASDNNRQMHVSEPLLTKPSSRPDANGTLLRTAIEIPESQSNASSASSAEIGNIPLAEWHPENQGNEQTPESQKPLLTDKNRASSSASQIRNPKSIPINSIVDRNGSPRLAAQGDAHLNLLQDNSDTRTSAYAQNSSDSSLVSSSEDRRTWSKFQRDMLQEYGIPAQELANAPNRPGFTWNNAKAQTTSADTVFARNEQDRWTRQSTMGPPRMKAIPSIEKSTGNLDEKITPEPDRDPFLERKKRVPRSTEIPSAGQPMCEASRGASDPMEWISALQAAQSNAHHLLQDTNQVSLSPAWFWGYAKYIELVEPASCRAGDDSPSAADLPTGM